MGNSKSVFSALGATNHSETTRDKLDFYATDPKAVELLLNKEVFNERIWEPCCGNGHIAKTLMTHGYNVKCSDIVRREFDCEELDFLSFDGKWDGDIITNPPYKDAQKFVEKAMSVVEEGARVVMLLKIQFLEGKARRKLFEKYPPKFVYVSTSRINCPKNGDFSALSGASAVCYCWFIWEKGFCDDPRIKWFN